jgi:NAD(P)H-hydrate epimerase
MTRLFLTAQQSRAVDRFAIDRLGVPGIVLMENAGRGATDRIINLAASLPSRPLFVIFTGSGNNAGDGFVVARHLACCGHDPILIRATPPERLTGDARIMSDICQNLTLSAHMATNPGDWQDAWLDPHRPRVLIDALMGTGARGPARPHFADLIRHCNRLRRLPHTLTLALDVPSGFDVDTGETSDPTIEADLTLTFCTMKLGFTRPGCDRHTGRVEVISIGLPEQAIRASLTNPPAP